MLKKINRIILNYKNKNSEIKKNLNDIHSLELFKNYLPEYIPWTRCSIRPRALALILNEIIIHKRKSVLEFGSGISTILLSRFAKEYKFKLVSIESDLNWMGIVKSNIDSKNKNITIIHAPIKNLKLDEKKYNWYCIDTIKNHLNDDKLDVMIVDGPSGKLNDLARYPALPIMQKYFDDDYSIFLDDIHRLQEKRIAQDWVDKFSLDYKEYKYQGDIGILRPKNTTSKYDII